ncbi:hypothetical protein [Fibrobacter sp.]|uniref:hypothetical protein n=1 Tax=Fibrobacter sp. TaxID=35828 RepID=UPI00388F0371
MDFYALVKQKIAERGPSEQKVISIRNISNKRYRENHKEELRERNREYEKTDKAKARHKRWRQTEAGRESLRKRGERYRHTEKGGINNRKKSNRYYARHKNDPEFIAKKRAYNKAYRAMKRNDPEWVAKKKSYNQTYQAKKKESKKAA